MKLSAAWKGASELQKDAITGTALGVGISGTMATITKDPSSLAGDIVGAAGQELIEYGVKNAFAKQTTGIIAQQVSSGAVKQAAAQVGKQVAGQVAKQAAAAGLRTTLTTAAKTAATTAAKAAMSLAGGPIGLALLLVSLTLGFLDMFWNPWKNYFNKDLQEMIDQLNDTASQQFKLQGNSYPIVIKPNIRPQTEEEVNEFEKEIVQYLRDRNLIFPTEAYEQVVKRLDDYEQYRVRKMQITSAHLALLQEGSTTFLQQEQDANWQQITDFADASRAKNQISDKMAQYMFISMTQEDIQTNRTQLLLYTALLYKKGILLPPSQRSIFTDIKQYVEVYWFRLLFYLISFISIIFSLIIYNLN